MCAQLSRIRDLGPGALPCRPAIYPLEFVNIWNKNNGQRLSTYVIYGEPGSRCCVLNGAAARACEEGDEVIISAVEFVNGPHEIAGRSRGC